MALGIAFYLLLQVFENERISQPIRAKMRKGLCVMKDFHCIEEDMLIRLLPPIDLL